jgi:hypothetical protein
LGYPITPATRVNNSNVGRPQERGPHAAQGVASILLLKKHDRRLHVVERVAIEQGPAEVGAADPGAAHDRAQFQAPRSSRRCRILGPSQYRRRVWSFEAFEFAQFLKVALGSLFETRNHLIDLRDRGIITDQELKNCDELAKRAIGATTGLRNYLLSDRNQVSKRRTYKSQDHPAPADRREP